MKILNCWTNACIFESGHATQKESCIISTVWISRIMFIAADILRELRNRK